MEGKQSTVATGPLAADVFDAMRPLVGVLRQLRLPQNEDTRNVFLGLARKALTHQHDRVARLIVSAAMRALLPPKTVKRAKRDSVTDSVVL